MAENTGQAYRSEKGRLPLWPFTLIALLLGVALFGDRGVVHMLRLNTQKAELLAEVAAVEHQATTLREEIQALHSDRRTIERIARTELGMVREDELVFQFTSRPATPSASATDSSQ